MASILTGPEGGLVTWVDFLEPCIDSIRNLCWPTDYRKPLIMLHNCNHKHGSGEAEGASKVLLGKDMHDYDKAL